MPVSSVKACWRRWIRWIPQKKSASNFPQITPWQLSAFRNPHSAKYPFPLRAHAEVTYVRLILPEMTTKADPCYQANAQHRCNANLDSQSTISSSGTFLETFLLSLTHDHSSLLLHVCLHSLTQLKLGQFLCCWFDGEFHEKREFICEKVSRWPEWCCRRVYTSLPWLCSVIVSLRIFVSRLFGKWGKISALPNWRKWFPVSEVG